MTELRKGITTGTCAAAAAKAAAYFLVNGKKLDSVEIDLPGGEILGVAIEDVSRKGISACAVVKKDAGDDPDVTHGVEVLATVAIRSDNEVILSAGEGVGTVTKPGLAIPVGEPAINPVPRKMITQAVKDVASCGFDVSVSIPGGDKIALNTFNPRLGVVGGLSILGTSGRVHPYSSKALKCTIKCNLDVAAASGIKAPVLVPGRIGENAAMKLFGLERELIIQINNEWGFALDAASMMNFEAMLLLGHPGKLAKLAYGQWDTHSSRSKSAAEFVRETGVEVLSQAIDESPTVEGIFSGLEKVKSQQLGDHLSGLIMASVAKRIDHKFPVSVVLVDIHGNYSGSRGDLSRWKCEKIQ